MNVDAPGSLTDEAEATGRVTGFQRRRFLLALAGCAIAAPARGAGAPTSPEVTALLDRLAQSRCSFYRNGTWYDAVAARQHLEKKYRYLAGRSLVATTEDFIRLGATSSSTSGEPYRVRCGSETRPSADWLTRELAAVRGRTPGR